MDDGTEVCEGTFIGVTSTMHIILDSNIYASDYRMTGVAFRTLFDYMRRTKSELVLPRLIREEVVLDYGRRLKSEAKKFAEVWGKYNYLDIDADKRTFTKPDVGYAMKKMRRRLMRPSDAVVPLYLSETTGVSVDDVFIRGARRTRPSNDEGEELRDVIIWLSVVAYSNALAAPTAFISNDSGFWANDGPHPDIEKDLRANKHLRIYRSIDDFAKQHAPEPIAVTREWLDRNFHIQAVESQLIDRAAKALRLNGTVRDLAIEKHEFQDGMVYDVAPETQFAELRYKLVFAFTYLQEPPRQSGFFGLSSPFNMFALNPGLGGINPLAVNLSLQADPAAEKEFPQAREVRCKAEAKISVRIKQHEPSETAVDAFELDRWGLQMELYRKKEKQ